MTRNTPKFDPRWNGGLSCTGLHTGTRFSVRSGRNGMESTTLKTIMNLSGGAWESKCDRAPLDFLKSTVFKKISAEIN
jgi:hypothetical protein